MACCPCASPTWLPRICLSSGPRATPKHCHSDGGLGCHVTAKTALGDTKPPVVQDLCENVFAQVQQSRGAKSCRCLKSRDANQANHGPLLLGHAFLRATRQHSFPLGQTLRKYTMTSATSTGSAESIAGWIRSTSLPTSKQALLFAAGHCPKSCLLPSVHTQYLSGHLPELRSHSKVQASCLRNEERKRLAPQSGTPHTSN